MDAQRRTLIADSMVGRGHKAAVDEAAVLNSKGRLEGRYVEGQQALLLRRRIGAYERAAAFVAMAPMAAIVMPRGVVAGRAVLVVVAIRGGVLMRMAGTCFRPDGGRGAVMRLTHVPMVPAAAEPHVDQQH